MDINLKAKNILDLYNDDNQDIDYISKQFKEGNYIVLPDTISIGNVYKIIYEGGIEEYGYEKAYLYIPTGSGIKKHTHKSDVERYTLIYGIMSIDGVCNLENECLIGDSHSIDIVDEDTVVKTLKITNELINKSEINISNEKKYIK